MKRCTKCILPEIYPNITFDENGVCNYCLDHVEIDYLGSSKLKEDLAQYKGTNGKYDCLVPLSGGKDSTFVLYQMSKVYNMRVLAYNYDNGLTHPQAQENVRGIADSLDVDLVIKKNEKQKKYFVTNLKAYIRKPSVGMVPMFCTGCRYGIIGNAIKIAKQNDIPLIAIGWSPIEDTPFKIAYLKGDSHSEKIGLLRNLISNPSYMTPVNLIAAIKDYYHNYQHVKDWNIILKTLYPNIKLLQFYDYIPYNPDEIQQIVEKEVAWKTPDKKDSWQWDCKIKLFQNYFYDKQVGFTATDGYLSSMIREGFITRSDALQRLDYLKQDKNGKLDDLYRFLDDNSLEELKPHFS